MLLVNKQCGVTTAFMETIGDVTLLTQSLKSLQKQLLSDKLRMLVNLFLSF